MVSRLRILFSWCIYQPYLFKEMENKWHEKFFVSPVILPKLLIAWGLNPGWTGASPTRYLDYLPDYKTMVNIQLKYITLNTFNTYIQQICDFFCQAASLFLLMVTVFPFWVIICFYSSLVLPDSRTSFHLHRESGPNQLTNVNSLEGGCLLKFKTIGSAEWHSGSAITNR
jgi:hypothetical protein